MPTRLSILRECLTLTGNNLFDTPDDDTPEWNVSSAAFDAGVRWLLGEHDWNFATEIEEIAADVDGSAVAIAPSDPNYTYRHTRPSEAMHIVKVMAEDGTKLTDYRIVGNKVFASVDTILLEYILEPDPDDWDPLFTKAITHAVIAGCYRGLNKDATAAQREQIEAERTIAKARPRTDLQEPGRARFISTLAAARRVRRG